MNETLSKGRAAADARAWAEAYGLLSTVDDSDPLDELDLERLAFASYMIGREDEMVAYLERVHRLHLEADNLLAAAKAGIWIGMNLALRGQGGPASGWFGRAQRLIERHGRPCAEAGFLLIPVIIQSHAAGDYEAGIAAATRAIEIGVDFDEADLTALALHGKGRVLIRHGSVAEGLRLLDEAMVAVTADDLTPMVSGIIYCSVIEECYEVQELRRAHSWTEALSAWCGGQSGLVAFTGQCMTHRAELMQLRGDWEQALREAQRAGERFFEGMNQLPAAQAHYRQGELHRLRLEHELAEQAYQEASKWGWSPQPGLALLRLAQGRVDAAKAALKTAVQTAHEPVEQARYLPALVEVLLAAGHSDEAAAASLQLDEIAHTYGTTMIGAAARASRGAVLLALGRLQEALETLLQARDEWLEMEAPYETARVRVLVGQAYSSLGDADSGELELGAARAAFEQLGAAADLERLGGASDTVASPLTDREIDVLRLVATGKTNKAIGEELFLSPRTIDRHLSNIFTKLGVGSRTAAAAYAFEHGLI